MVKIVYSQLKRLESGIFNNLDGTLVSLSTSHFFFAFWLWPYEKYSIQNIFHHLPFNHANVTTLIFPPKYLIFPQLQATPTYHDSMKGVELCKILSKLTKLCQMLP
jgi:hypothetical protein